MTEVGWDNQARGWHYTRSQEETEGIVYYYVGAELELPGKKSKGTGKEVAWIQSGHLPCFGFPVHARDVSGGAITSVPTSFASVLEVRTNQIPLQREERPYVVGQVVQSIDDNFLLHLRLLHAAKLKEYEAAGELSREEFFGLSQDDIAQVNTLDPTYTRVNSSGTGDNMKQCNPEREAPERNWTAPDANK